MSKQIFVVFSCNTWKSRPMPFLMATTSALKVKMFISKMIENDEAYYIGRCDRSDPTQKQQAKQFRKDFDSLPRNEVNDLLHYVYFDYVYDGEEP